MQNTSIDIRMTCISKFIYTYTNTLFHIIACTHCALYKKLNQPKQDPLGCMETISKVNNKRLDLRGCVTVCCILQKSGGVSPGMLHINKCQWYPTIHEYCVDIHTLTCELHSNVDTVQLWHLRVGASSVPRNGKYFEEYLLHNELKYIYLSTTHIHHQRQHLIRF